MTKLVRAILVALPLVSALGIDPAVAQQDPIAQCRNVTDSLERLTCYDGIPLAAGATERSSGKHQKIGLDEFKVDQSTLKGQLVELQGNLTLFGEMLMLQDGQMDMSPIIVEFTDLPRDQRLRIVQRCGTGCQATVQGRVADVFFQTGVIATSVSVR